MGESSPDARPSLHEVGSVLGKRWVGEPGGSVLQAGESAGSWDGERRDHGLRRRRSGSRTPCRGYHGRRDPADRVPGGAARISLDGIEPAPGEGRRRMALLRVGEGLSSRAAAGSRMEPETAPDGNRRAGQEYQTPSFLNRTRNPPVSAQPTPQITGHGIASEGQG